HDAVCTDGTKRKVQIKSTMKESLTFPCDHVPDYLIGVKIDKLGNLEEIFNGPGRIIKEKLNNRKITKTNLFSVSNNTLKILNKSIPTKKKIPERNK
ncbi:MAG: hypothetical protein P8Z35_26420, partial [Ignavibacteriaceae bacterium]